ncbi:MAG: SAM-dependent methyltransferase [Actinobacteria bacterium]|nr:SAM-dependent methyltransferase [Actinomycetota bacterium]
MWGLYARAGRAARPDRQSGSDYRPRWLLTLTRSLRFDEFLAAALYGDNGFYSVAGRAGRRGDFLTSPEVGPLFGAVLARWIEAEFQRLGRPDDFQVIEVGAGPGTLARAILLAAPEWSDRYTAVEISAAQRTSHPDGITSSAELPTGSLCGVVIANELLDNLPFRLAVYDGGWREAVVTVLADGTAQELLTQPPPEWNWLPVAAPHGSRLPIQEQASAWVAKVRSQLRQGTVLAFDYFTARTDDLLDVPWRDWLRTYRGHQRGDHYLRSPGAQDITAQVCLDQLPEPSVVRTQAQFLQRWGIDELVAQGRAQWAAAAAAPTLTALRMRSRVSEAESLLDPAGLGDFLAVEWATV